MFTPLEYSTVGLSEEQAVLTYDEDSIDVSVYVFLDLHCNACLFV